MTRAIDHFDLQSIIEWTWEKWTWNELWKQKSTEKFKVNQRNGFSFFFDGKTALNWSELTSYWLIQILVVVVESGPVPARDGTGGGRLGRDGRSGRFGRTGAASLRHRAADARPARPIEEGAARRRRRHRRTGRRQVHRRRRPQSARQSFQVAGFAIFAMESRPICSPNRVRSCYFYSRRFATLPVSDLRQVFWFICPLRFGFSFQGRTPIRPLKLCGFRIEIWPSFFFFFVYETQVEREPIGGQVAGPSVQGEGGRRNHRSRPHAHQTEADGEDSHRRTGQDSRRNEPTGTDRPTEAQGRPGCQVTRRFLFFQRTCPGASSCPITLFLYWCFTSLLLVVTVLILLQGPGQECLVPQEAAAGRAGQEGSSADEHPDPEDAAVAEPDRHKGQVGLGWVRLG